MHAWATLLVYETELEQRGEGDLAWLKSAFQKLLVNFTWWVNRKDPTGRNVFEGGFLGLDNIGVFDRSAPLPTGGRLEQADGTAWMALFTQSMLGIAVELAAHDPVYEDMVLKFAEHFVCIAAAMDRVGDHPDEMWDEEDGFFYDVLRLPDGSGQRLKVRSLVGLLPLCATTHRCPRAVDAVSEDLLARLRRRIDAMPRAAGDHPRRPRAGRQRAADARRSSTRTSCAGSSPGCSTRTVPRRRTASGRCRATTSTTRSASTSHGQTYEVHYVPAESDTGMFGGNSNWRGPVWFPVNYLILRGAAAALPLLRRRLQGRVPDRLGPADDAVRGGRRSSGAG